MSLSLLNSFNISVNKRSLLCLLLFVLSLLSIFVATNNMMSSAYVDITAVESNQASNTMSHHSLSDGGSSCSFTSDKHPSLMADDEHKNCIDCIDSHCSSFSGLLASYALDTKKIPSVLTNSLLAFYVSTHPSTPYYPPIVIS